MNQPAKHLHIILTLEQKKLLDLYSFYSGKSISDIVRIAIDRLPEKEFVTTK